MIAFRLLSLAVVLVVCASPAGRAQSGAADASAAETIGNLTYLVTAAQGSSPAGIPVDAEMNKARGGNNSGKSLGCYFCPKARVFSSEYVNESSGTIARWTHDLHVFMSGNSRQYDLDRLPPYKAVRAFAATWWKQNSPAFNGRPPMHQSSWIYESILDGVQIWGRYLILGNVASADTVMYFDAALSVYEKASPSDIFF